MIGTRVTILSSEGAQRVRSVFETVRAQPGWVTRFAILTMLFVIGLPIVLLVMLALIAGIVVFGTLAGANILMNRVRQLFPRHDGRENVRVIRRAD